MHTTCPSHSRLKMKYALHNRKYDMITKLIQEGVDINEQDEHGCTALHQAAQSGFCLDLVLTANPNCDIQDDFGNTALMLACCEGRCRLIRIMCEAGADVNIGNQALWTPLTKIMEKKHLDCVEVLIKHGAQLSERDCQHFISSVSLSPDYGPIFTYLLKVTGGIRTHPVRLLARNLAQFALQDPSIAYCLVEFMVIVLDLGCVKDLKTSDTLLRDYMNTPPMLKQLCRLVIRELVGASISSDLYHQLPLPTSLKSYLALEIIGNLSVQSFLELNLKSL